MSSARNEKGTWSRAGLELLGAVVFVLAVRWALFEPYVIPSGSMIPSLLVHDHILVNKFAYGLRIPFGSTYLVRWAEPRRGEVIVFRSVDEASIFLVKRVVGVPGDKVEIREGGGVWVNGAAIATEEMAPSEIRGITRGWPEDEREEYESDYSFFRETLGETKVVTLRRRTSGEVAEFQVSEFQVPDGHLFMMGDNRDNSGDSRAFGPLPLDHVLGRAVGIWLSCEETLREASRVCDPNTVRWNRMFRAVK